MTKEQFQRITTAKLDRVEIFWPWLEKYMTMFDIVGKLREAAFVAQLLWECGQLKYMEEIASGKAYEGRKDLGNNDPGDGVKYKGRGGFQLSGESNYVRYSKITGVDYVNNPEWLERSRDAMKVSCWYFKDRGLNELADKGMFNLITKRVNGGYSGLAQRTLIYEKALLVLKDTKNIIA